MLQWKMVNQINNLQMFNGVARSQVFSHGGCIGDAFCLNVEERISKCRFMKYLWCLEASIKFYMSRFLEFF